MHHLQFKLAHPKPRMPETEAEFKARKAWDRARKAPEPKDVRPGESKQDVLEARAALTKAREALAKAEKAVLATQDEATKKKLEEVVSKARAKRGS